MNSHLFCAILMLIISFVSYCNAKQDGYWVPRKAWTAVGIFALTITQLSEALPTSSVSDHLNDILVGFAFGVGITALVAAAKSRNEKMTDLI